MVTLAAMQEFVMFVVFDAGTSTISADEMEALLVIFPVGALGDTRTVKLTLLAAPGTRVPMSHVKTLLTSLGHTAVAGSHVALVTVTFGGNVSVICTPVALLNPGAPGAAVLA